MYDVNLIRNDFPMLKSKSTENHWFLDNASTTLNPKLLLKQLMNI